MSTCMYKMRPLLNHDEPVPKPTHSMYFVKPIHDFVAKASTNTVRLSELSGHIRETMKGSRDEAALEKRQEEILQRLAQLQLNVKSLRSELQSKQSKPTMSINLSVNKSPLTAHEFPGTENLVVYASPLHPPYFLLGLAKLWGPAFVVKIQNHTHSSLKEAPAVAGLFSTSATNNPFISVSLIWKDVGPETELVINPVKHSAIRGETNILRYLSRVGPPCTAYENDEDLIRITEVDKVLDICQRLARQTTVKEKQASIRSLNAVLGKSQWMCGLPEMTIVDVAVWSVLKQLGSVTDLTPTLSKWIECCDSKMP